MDPFQRCGHHPLFPGLVKICLLFLISAAAAAAQVRLTVAQEVALFGAIRAIDQGGIKMIDNKAASVPFDLSADTHFTLAKDLNLLQPDAQAFEQARIAESARDFPKGTDSQDVAANAKFQAAMSALGAKKADLPLLTIAKAELHLDSNPFPVSVLAGLIPIIRP
jgi:hypothetical protein